MYLKQGHYQNLDNLKSIKPKSKKTFLQKLDAYFSEFNQHLESRFEWLSFCIGGIGLWGISGKGSFWEITFGISLIAYSFWEGFRTGRKEK